MAAGKRAQRMEQKRQDALKAAVALFLQQGYHATKLEQIARAIDSSTASLLRAYADKEAILHALMTELVELQFETVRTMLREDAEPILVYAVKSALQLTLCEQHEAQRDIYVTAYTLPTTSDFIYHANTAELAQIVFEYMPELLPSDIFELEIAAGSMMRGYMSRRCDLYFPVERKCQLFLDCCMKIFEIPPQKREEVIAAVLGMDIDAMAKRISRIMGMELAGEPLPADA